MKKYSLIIGLLLSANNSLADAYDEFYVRAEVGGGYFEKNASASNEKKLKNSKAFIGGLALGTNMQPNLRTELMASNTFNAIEKSDGKTSIVGFNNTAEQQKLYRQSLILRILPDFYDFGYGKLYGIGGIGISKISNTANITLTDAAGANRSEFSKVNPKYVPSFTLGGGAGFFLNENFMLDVSYYYLHSGTTKSKEININGKQIQTGKMKVNSHNIGLGVRFIFN